jgi:hypothetical protein
MALTKTGQNCCRIATLFQQLIREPLESPKSRQMLDFLASRPGQQLSNCSQVLKFRCSLAAAALRGAGFLGWFFGK